MIGPKTKRNTGTDFQDQVNRLFRDEPPAEEEEKEEPPEGDKNGEKE